MSKKNVIRSSKNTSSTAGKILSKKSTPKPTKKLAASVLNNRKKRTSK